MVTAKAWRVGGDSKGMPWRRVFFTGFHLESRTLGTSNSPRLPVVHGDDYLE